MMEKITHYTKVNTPSMKNSRNEKIDCSSGPWLKEYLDLTLL